MFSWGRRLRTAGPYPLPQAPSPNPIIMDGSAGILPVLKLGLEAPATCYVYGVWEVMQGEGRDLRSLDLAPNILH